MPPELRRPGESREGGPGALPEALATALEAAPDRYNIGTRKPAAVILERDGALVELPLSAKGGVKPLRWLVNGQPLAADPWRREAFWPPDGVGLARITVLDQAGQTASAEVWISRGEGN